MVKHELIKNSPPRILAGAEEGDAAESEPVYVAEIPAPEPAPEPEPVFQGEDTLQELMSYPGKTYLFTV
jgi:hypothetical protein